MAHATLASVRDKLDDDDDDDIRMTAAFHTPFACMQRRCDLHRSSSLCRNDKQNPKFSSIPRTFDLHFCDVSWILLTPGESDAR